MIRKKRHRLPIGSSPWIPSSNLDPGEQSRTAVLGRNISDIFRNKKVNSGSLLKGTLMQRRITTTRKLLAAAIALTGIGGTQLASISPANAQTATCTVVVDPSSQSWTGGYNQKLRITGTTTTATLTITLPTGHTITSGWSAFAATTGTGTKTLTITPTQLQADGGYLGGYTVTGNGPARPTYTCSTGTTPTTTPPTTTPPSTVTTIPPTTPSAVSCTITVDATSQSWTGGYNQKLNVTFEGDDFVENPTVTISLPAGHTISGGWSTFAGLTGTGTVSAPIPLTSPYLGGYTVTGNGPARPTYICGAGATIPTTTLRPTTVPTNRNCTVTVDPTSQIWEGGYNQKLTIINTGTTPLFNPTITITLPQGGHTITGGWSTFNGVAQAPSLTNSLSTTLPTTTGTLAPGSSSYLGGFTVQHGPVSAEVSAARPTYSCTNGTNATTTTAPPTTAPPTTAPPTTAPPTTAPPTTTPPTTAPPAGPLGTLFFVKEGFGYEDVSIRLTCDNGFSNEFRNGFSVQLPTGTTCTAITLQAFFTSGTTRYTSAVSPNQRTYVVPNGPQIISTFANFVSRTLFTVNLVSGPDGTNKSFLQCPTFIGFETLTIGARELSVPAGFPCRLGTGSNQIVLVPTDGQVVTVKTGTYSTCTRVEAESGTVSGGTLIQNLATASGGQVVGSFASPGSNTLTYNGPVTGIRFNYFSNGGATRNITIDGIALPVTFPEATAQTINFDNPNKYFTISPGQQHTVTIDVPPNAGGMGLDYIEFCN
jgi:hypothetical protein